MNIVKLKSVDRWTLELDSSDFPGQEQWNLTSFKIKYIKILCIYQADLLLYYSINETISFAIGRKHHSLACNGYNIILLHICIIMYFAIQMSFVIFIQSYHHIMVPHFVRYHKFDNIAYNIIPFVSMWFASTIVFLKLSPATSIRILYKLKYKQHKI